MVRAGILRASFWTLALTAFAVACVGYGFFAHRNGLFPATQLEQLIQGARRLAGRGGSADWSHQGDGIFAKDGGFWARRQPATGDFGEELARLQALGYVDGSQAPAVRTGVTILDPERAAMGVNLYSSAHAPEAILMDMHGRALHRWRIDRDEVWPHLAYVDRDKARKYFRKVHLLDDGGLLAIFEYTGLVRLDASSRLLWARQAGEHHDLDVDREGRIYALVRSARRLPRWNVDVWDEAIDILSPEGEALGSVSISRAIENSRYAPLLDAVRPVEGPEPFDAFHTNELQRLDGSLEGVSPIFKEGYFLVSMRNLNAIAIIDPIEERVVWALTGASRAQHAPVALARGTILFFDNLARLDRSSVVELDPLTQRVVWEYSGTRDEPLFSALFGANSRLPNGNTLVTESDRGRVLEVTPSKEIVWEFVSPHTSGPEGEFVAVIPELVRLPPESPLLDFAETSPPIGPSLTGHASVYDN